MIKLYGIPNCNKIRNTIKILENQEQQYEFVNVRKTPISKVHLEEMVDALGMEVVFNKKGSTYRRLNLNYEHMSDTERFIHIYNEQSMINRPLLEHNGRYHIGFDENAILDFIK